MYVLSLLDLNESCCLLYFFRSIIRFYVSFFVLWLYLLSGFGCVGNLKIFFMGLLIKDNGWVKLSIEVRFVFLGGCFMDFV